MNRQQRRVAVRHAAKSNSASGRMPSKFELAAAHFRNGRVIEGDAVCRSILASGTEDSRNLHLLGLIAHKANRHDLAVELIRRVISASPRDAQAYISLSGVLIIQGKIGEAIRVCQQALALSPDSAMAHFSLGRALERNEQFAEAVAAYERAVNLDQNCVEAHLNLGKLCAARGQNEAAAAAFREVIRINPRSVDAHRRLSRLLRDNGLLQEAETCLRQALVIDPNECTYHSDLGIVLLKQGRLGEAVDACKAALAIRPGDAATLTNLGNILHDLGHSDEAITAYRFAIQLDPKLASTIANLATVYRATGRIQESIDALRNAVAIEPNRAKYLGELCHQRRAICDWDGLADDEAKVLSLCADGRSIDLPSPFTLLSVPGGEPADLLTATRTWAQRYQLPESRRFQHPVSAEHVAWPRRLRIGYLSADYHYHATSFLVAELLEKHDRSRFEVFGYSTGPDDKSAIRQRVVNAFDRFFDLRFVPYAEAARRIFEDRIDILVDLKGHTRDARTEILALRPAPIQVNYLGYPGTMGVDFIDYVVGDPIVLPMNDQPYYTEKIVQLPYCYQPNDTKRQISEVSPTRSQCGLPEDGFVFCCFNNSYKITEKLFDIWMRLLVAVPESVLWLLGSRNGVEENLRREAAKRGVDPIRLVFAKKLPLADHLARHRNADLFLDTLPYNAHTTTSDALWAGLPVLTCRGNAFAGRVAASLLHAVGLPEMVTSSLQDYEDLAITLARTPEKLAEIKQKLARNRMTTPLFDIDTYTRGLERAFIHMVDLRCSGAQPNSFSVADLPDVPPIS